MTLTRRTLLQTGASTLAATALPRLLRAAAPGPPIRIFDPLKFGARGDGLTLDTAAIQRAIDAAAAYSGKAQVLLRGGHKFLAGTLQLHGRIDFHLADDAQILASLRPEDYLGGPGAASVAETMASSAGALILATAVQGLTISGTGTLQGRARSFMRGYDKPNEWWLPNDWRPKMFVLTQCTDLEVRDITFAEAPNWGLHMLGCDRVLVDHIKIRNLLDVPNCDGIDPDHSRNVTIRNCDIIAGDDAVVIKTSRQTKDYGPAAHIHVHDCVIQTQDAGLKIGTETTSEINDIRFERCKILTSSRALCIQLRDEADVHDILFRDITFHSRFYSAPWWGRGEGISFTAVPRTPTTVLGKLSNVRVENVSGTAENSSRVFGTESSRPHNITFSNVSLTLDRSTNYPGHLFDNRPTFLDTGAGKGILPHDTPGFAFDHVDDLTLSHCKVTFGPAHPDQFTHALEAHDCPRLSLVAFTGQAAQPSLPAISQS